MASHSAPAFGDPLKIAQFGYTRLLARRHNPFLIDGTLIDGLPDRALRPDELGVLLSAASPENGLADRVWRHLASRARAERGETLLVCAGLAMPALIRASRELRGEWRGYTGDFRDAESALLAGFFTALTARQDGRPGVLWRLKWAAHHAGRAYLRREIAADTPCEDIQPLPIATTASAASGAAGIDDHLGQAVAAGVITAVDASLIAATRIDGLTLAAAAAASGRSYSAAAKARRRAEQKLETFLRTHATTASRACGHSADECADRHPECESGTRCPEPDVAESAVVDTKGFIGGPTESTPHPALPVVRDTASTEEP